MKANYPAAAEIERIDAVRGELVKQIEALDAERRAWAEVARKGVRLVEHITVTQSTDGQWAKIADLYESFDTLVDAAGIGDASLLDPEAFSIASDARRKATR